MRNQGGRRRLAVGTGDRDERRFRRARAPLAAEQLDVADHFDTRGAREQRARARQSRPAETEEGNLLSGKDGDGNHHLSLSVDRPTRASTTEMIQKRITICGSVQPSCSK